MIIPFKYFLSLFSLCLLHSFSFTPYPLPARTILFTVCSRWSASQSCDKILEKNKQNKWKEVSFWLMASKCVLKKRRLEEVVSVILRSSPPYSVSQGPSNKPGALQCGSLCQPSCSGSPFLHFPPFHGWDCGQAAVPTQRLCWFWGSDLQLSCLHSKCFSIQAISTALDLIVFFCIITNVHSYSLVMYLYIC